MFDTAWYVGIQGFMLSVLAIIVLTIAGGCIYAFVHAIFLFIFSQGNEDKRKSARNSIRYMIIGIVLTITLLTIFPLLLRQLQVEGYEVYTARNIFERAGDILEGVINIGQQSVDNSRYYDRTPSSSNYSL
jgi:uncharacterized membrane protein